MNASTVESRAGAVACRWVDPDHFGLLHGGGSIAREAAALGEEEGSWAAGWEAGWAAGWAAGIAAAEKLACSAETPPPPGQNSGLPPPPRSPPPPSPVLEHWVGMAAAVRGDWGGFLAHEEAQRLAAAVAGEGDDYLSRVGAGLLATSFLRRTVEDPLLHVGGATNPFTSISSLPGLHRSQPHTCAR